MNPKTVAINLLEELGINSFPIRPEDIIDSLKIFRKEHSFKSIEGCFFLNPSGQAFIFVNSKIKGKRRKNFTYAHELGHFCLDSLNSDISNCQKSDINNISKGLNKSEINANIFASHLLLPGFLIKDKIKNIDPDWKALSKWADMTEVSLITMACRFMELTNHICLLAIINHNKVVKYFKKSSNWSLYFDMDSRIVSPQSYAYKACNRDNIPNDFEYVPANIWVPDKRISYQADLLEWSLPLNSYGDVLTLLWDDTNILEKDEYKDIIYSNNKIGGVWDPPTFHKSKRKP